METETLPPEKNLSSKKHSRFWIFLFVGLAILLLSISALWKFLQRPAIGDIRVNTVVTEISAGEKKAEKQYKGEYLTFSYPDIYTEKSHTLPLKGPIKESVFLSSARVTGEKMAVVIEEREGNEFEASPGFQMRINKLKEYTREDVTISGYKGVLFQKNTPVFERTFFLRDTNFVVTISTTSPVSGDGLDQELSSLIESIRFLQ
jgi:hypothetical protein